MFAFHPDHKRSFLTQKHRLKTKHFEATKSPDSNGIMEDMKAQVEFPNGDEETSPLTQKLSDVVVRSSFGRARKPKVLYDPSDVDEKRKSLPNMEFKKPKPQPPAPKTPEAENESSTKSKPTTEPTTDADSFKKPGNINLSPSQIKSNVINKRRQTIGPANFENGCIVCTRSDTNKGRFVNCMDCIKRGHFTCLRTAKLFKTADTEKTWQCPTCKICVECRDHEPVVINFLLTMELSNINYFIFLVTLIQADLIKCLKCHNSFHAKCINVNPKLVVRKKFTCKMCTFINEKETKNSVPTEAPKLEALDIIKMSNDGFAGFSRDETAKRKSNDSQSTAAKAKKARKQKSTDDSDQEIKSEPESYACETKKREELPKSSPNAARNENIISVRKDLVSRSDDDLIGDLDVDELQYNTKSSIRPHEDVPDVKTWDCDTVYVYFRSKTNDEYANLLKENQIDGDALLLIKREDVLNRFNLKLGPALRLYSHIVALQCRNNNPILSWN